MKKEFNLFPSPYGVLFILINMRVSVTEWLIFGFRLLTEYYSFLCRLVNCIFIHSL